MNIGSKIYYDLETGDIIQNTGDRTGDVRETTRERDFAVYVSLAERAPDTVGLLQLEYGQFAENFREASGYRVDVSGETPSLLFSYPEPGNDPQVPPVYRAPLSVEVTQLKADNLTLMEAVAEIYELVLSGGVAA